MIPPHLELRNRRLHPLAYVLVGLLYISAWMPIACARHTPPNLTPQALTAWKSHEVQKDLDLLRDVAVDANAQAPPLLTTATTKQVVTYHASAIKLIHDGSAGWQTVVSDGLDELLKNVPPKERQQLAPYVALVKTVLHEVYP